MKRKATTQSSTQPTKKPTLKRQNASLINPPVRKQLTPELKNIDANQQNSIVFNTTAGVIALLNGCDDGAIPGTRVGRRITMKSITWRFQMTLAPTTTGSSVIRNLIVYDRQPNAATPTVNQITNVDTVYSPMNLSYSRRFSVISDKCFVIGTQGPQAIEDHGFAKLNLETEFNDNSTNTITSIVTGAIWLVQWQDGNLLVATPNSNFYSRVRFSDI